MRAGAHATAWTFEARALRGELSELERLLSPEERERARRLVRADRQRDYLVGRGTLRRLLAPHLGCPPGRVPITYGPHGKPMVQGGAPSFNLSHCDGHVAIALGFGTDVGIDLERVRGGQWLELARRFFTSVERDHLSTRPERERDRAFLELWTRKEAYLKARGDGLSAALDAFSVPVGDLPGGGADLVARASEGWRVFAIEGRGELVGACVVRRGARLELHPGVPPHLTI